MMDGYPPILDPESDEVVITTWEGEKGFVYRGDANKIYGFLTFPMRSDQTLDSVKYKITDDTLMIFINLKELPSKYPGKTAMTVYVSIVDKNIDGLITSKPPFKFKKPVKVFINGDEVKVVGGEQVHKELVIAQ